MKAEISSWFSEELLTKDAISSLHKSFVSATPFPHILIEAFLVNSQAKKLLDSLKKETFEKKQSDLFSLSQTQDFATTEQKALKEFYELFKSKEFTKMISTISGLKLKAGKIDTKKTSSFRGAQEHAVLDMAGSLYEDTDYLLCHDDQLEGRKIAYIYYLSEKFTEKDGGALGLLSDELGLPATTVKRYAPVWNSIIFFEVSPKSWHEVEEVLSKKKRFAIGGWLY